MALISGEPGMGRYWCEICPLLMNIGATQLTCETSYQDKIAGITANGDIVIGNIFDSNGKLVKIFISVDAPPADRTDVGLAEFCVNVNGSKYWTSTVADVVNLISKLTGKSTVNTNE